MINKRLSPTVRHIVNILNDGQFHTGLALGKSLEISRTAVWKAIGQLQDFGISVESSKKKGYQLKEPLYLLDEDKILAAFKTPVRDDLDFQLFSSVPSTNDFPGVQDQNASVKVCLSEQQTQGRGRMGRTWQSPFAQNIYCSIQLQFDMDVSELGGFSLAVATTLVKTFDQIDAQGVKVKWPNDILYNGQKVAGILIEVKAESNAKTIVNIGMGINVNAELTDVNQPWTSLAKITGEAVDRNHLVGLLINYLQEDATQFAQQGLKAFKPIWEKNDFLKDKTITLTQSNQKFTGREVGIDDSGHLLVEIDGQVRPFSSGDTSLAK